MKEDELEEKIREEISKTLYHFVLAIAAGTVIGYAIGFVIVNLF